MRGAMVLYIFEVKGTSFVKMGFTSGCPWNRISDGFWKQVHPKECCHKLGWEDLHLIALSPGTLEDEASLKQQMPPACGEFWPVEDLAALKAAMKAMAIANHSCNDEDWELPLPPRPDVPSKGRGIEKQECCGGSLLKCFGCGKEFKLWIRLQTHKRESCPATAKAKVKCHSCGLFVIERHLKRHSESKRCQAARCQ